MKNLTIQELRKQHGLTQTQVAMKTGVASTEISDIENNRRNLTDAMAARLAPAFGMKARDLQYQHNIGLVDEYVASNKSTAPGRLVEKLREAISDPDLPTECKEAASKHLRNMTTDTRFSMKSLGRDSAGRYRQEIAEEHAVELERDVATKSSPMQDFAAPGTVRDLHGRARKNKDIQRDLHGRRIK